METPIYPKGFSVFAPHENAPDFVMAEVSISPRDFMAFIAENKEYINDKGYFRITLKKGKEDGKPYAQVNTYKPQPSV